MGRRQLRGLAGRPSPTVWAAVALASILVVGGALRLGGADWDVGYHLHPDERYLSIVANDVRGPGSVAGYFDVEDSPLSPYNTQSGRAYLYGQLPLFATKLVAALLGRDTYGELYLVGRRISAVVDLLSVLLVFLIGRELFAPLARNLALFGAVLASSLYALSVTAIQHAHFFTVESWLVFWTLMAFWLATLAVTRTGLGDRWRFALMLAVGAAIGAAISTKLSGSLVLVPVAIALGARALGGGARPAAARLAGAAAELLVVASAAYVAFRLTSPYAFARSSWLDLSPNRNFRTALEAQQNAIDGNVDFPPAYQWLLSDRIVDPARNLLGYGLGPSLGLAALAGIVILLVTLVRLAVARRRLGDLATDRSFVLALMLIAFVVVTFGYFGTRFAHSLRYLVPIAPFLCLAAAYGVLWLRRLGAVVPAIAAAALVVPTLAWAVAFTNVYRHPNTRVAATEWIDRNVVPGSVIVSEHWDDALPVGSVPGRYELRELPVFDPDDETKLGKLYEVLRDADFYALSSPRAWYTIGRLPDRFPLMVRFYELVREGRLGFARAATFTSLPSLLGASLDDLGAEESFWVYDHPRVEIYRRLVTLTPEEFRASICAGEPLPGC